MLGDTVRIAGARLDGANRAVRLRNDRLAVDRVIAAAAGAEAGEMQFIVPAGATDLPAAQYELSASVLRAGEIAPRTTNTLGLAIAPRITTVLPLTVTRDGAGTASIQLAVSPDVLPNQRVSLILGTREVLATAVAAPTGQLAFVLPGATPGTTLARLRVDGIDSVVIDRSVSPPAFLDQRIQIQ
jgi:hypothetical protein